jgi:hypothetical protein
MHGGAGLRLHPYETPPCILTPLHRIGGLENAQIAISTTDMESGLRRTLVEQSSDK